MLAQKFQCPGRAGQRPTQASAGVLMRLRSQAVRMAFTAAPASMVRPAPCMRQQRRVFAAAAEASALQDTPIQGVMEKGEMTQFPGSPAVYAVYDSEGTVQYIGLTRKLSLSVATHMNDLPELTHSIKYQIVASGTREDLTGAWKQWVEEAVAASGAIPPGNAPGETKWQSRAVRPAKPEIRLTAGKPISGVTMEQLIDQVVKDNKVVAFVKGTRTQPACGFSYKMLTMLNDMKLDYEVVNVLDELHNPNLREIIKTYSQWPTIPQLYVGGEFLGGADIVEQMVSSGEMAELLAAAK